jgi:hypothetical protein
LVKGLIRNRDINNKCKIDIYKVYLKNILLHGADSWTCTKREESKIEAMEMKFVREIIGKTRRDRIRNDIREQLSRRHKNRYKKKQTKMVWSRHAHGRREDNKEDAGDEVEGKKTNRQAKNQVDGPSNERCRKEGEEMDTGETRQGMGRQGQMGISL